MSKILVTGRCGYLGSRFAASLDPRQVISVSLSGGDALAFSGVSTVVHMSALVHQRGKVAEQRFFDINTHQTIALAERAKAEGVGHFIFMSSVAVYGEKGWFDDRPPLTPDSPCSPRDPYGASKLAAEQALWAMRTDDFKVSLIRPPLVYGPGCPGNMQRLLKLVRYSPVLPFAGCTNQRSMLAVDNLLSFLRLVIEQQAEGVLIPQDEESLSVEKLTGLLCATLGYRRYQIQLPAVILRALAGLAPAPVRSLFGSLLFDSQLPESLQQAWHRSATVAGVQGMAA